MKRWSFFLLIVLALGVSACSSDPARIATAVALTVQAQSVPTQNLIWPSATPTEIPLPSLTPTPDVTPTATLPPGSFAHCASASLVSENPPDQTIMAAGQKFWKTWRLRNESACTWTPEYKLVFWSGERMDGLFQYNLPQLVAPGQTVDVSIWLAAPTSPGTYKGEWKLQTPDGVSFGVGPRNLPFWVEIVVVAANVTPTYGVASVRYTLDRNPPSGCATNTWYTVTAYVSFNGPAGEVAFQFYHSDGGRSGRIKRQITEATTLTFTDQWKFHIADTQGPKWIQLVQLYPTYIEFDKVKFTFECP